MPTIVKMPKWGLTMTSGTVAGWLRDEGDEVSEGDPLLTVETEKAVNDIEAPAAGVLLKIVVPTGDEAAVSAPIAIIAAPGEALSEADLAALIASPAKGARAGRAASSRNERESRTATRDASGRVNASPAARKLANELGVDLSTVEATGPGGRITSDDVERAAAGQQDQPAARETMVAAGGLELAALIAGPGKTRPLLFLHGLGGNYGTWQVALGRLAERHRVVALDLPGHGKSSKPDASAFDYSLASLAKAIAEAIETLKLKQPIVVGHSLGGAVAIQLALDLGDRIGGLVLIDGAGLGREIGAELRLLMAGEAGRDTARGLLALFYHDQRLVLDRGVDEMAMTQMQQGAWPAQQAAANAAFDDAGQRFDLPGRLSEVAQPVLIIWGAHDRVIPMSHGVDAITRLSDALLKVIPAAGHVPQVEAPDVVAMAIDRFAKSLA
jgi:pyruvate dehydrogenase E2 component (dihydrolipoamide acetyltransferase)